MCFKHCCIFGGIFSSFQFSVFTENVNFHFFLKIDSATFFGLITHIIKLFQTVQIQKGRLKIVSQDVT